MGLEIDRSEFSSADLAAFRSRLVDCLAALDELLARPGFGSGPATLGAELEVSIIDAAGRPALLNETLRAAAADRNLTTELNRFNLEFDFDPRPARGRPFSHFRNEMSQHLARLQALAARHDAAIVCIGILPTLTAADFDRDLMTPSLRYQALTAGLKRLGGGTFQVEIDGEEPLHFSTTEITPEGAATSFQLHLAVEPAAFVDTWNAAQLATPVALALSANSPLFLGHRLWHETRIALFKQSIDPRDVAPGLWRPPARVSFGLGWLRRSALEPFAEGVALHEPLLPIVADENPIEVLRAGGTPALTELRLHHGTIWSWNRAVYDPANGGHLRIEFRALPSGPTPEDMCANAALLLGLTRALAEDVDALLPGIPFRIADYNFYRAAQHGLDARLRWPNPSASGLVEVRAVDLAGQLIGRARDGLGLLGVDDAEIERYLGIIAARIEAEQSGASWQRQQHARLAVQRDPIDALHALLDAYRGQQRAGKPVHEWGLQW